MNNHANMCHSLGLNSNLIGSKTMLLVIGCKEGKGRTGGRKHRERKTRKEEGREVPQNQPCKDVGGREAGKECQFILGIVRK